jgi:hypothetical protein
MFRYLVHVLPRSRTTSGTGTTTSSQQRMDISTIRELEP